jgi:hypothetical protein
MKNADILDWARRFLKDRAESMTPQAAKAWQVVTTVWSLRQKVGICKNITYLKFQGLVFEIRYLLHDRTGVTATQAACYTVS